MNKLIEETWSKLLALSGGTKVKVVVPPSMSEDVRSTNVGSSFLNRITTDPPTLPLLLELSKQSFHSLLRPSGHNDNGPTFEVDPSAAQEFFHTTKPIVEALAFLVHATGSGPLRLSEVVDDRYCNGSSPRNVFMSHGMLFLVRRNLKPSSARGCRSSVVHFPPEKVADLLIYYLAVVRPVEIFLVAGLRWPEQHAAYSQFLYVIKGQQLTPQELSGVIARSTDHYFECRLTGLDLRHVLISLQAVFLPPIIDPSVQKFRDSQAGHSSRAANHIYGQRIDHLPGEEASLFVLAYHWCKKLHKLLGISSESPPTRPIPYIHAPSEPTWWSPSDYTPPPLPSTQEMMAQVHIAINSSLSSATQELSRLCTKVLRESVFQAIAASSVMTALDRQALVQSLPSTPDGLPTLTPMSDRVRSQLATPSSRLTLSSQSNFVSDLEQPTTFSTTSDEDTLLQILSLYTRRPESTFTSDNQRLLLRASLVGDHNSVIAVLPTGSGKSIAIFGPLLVESSGISLVITCYTALRRQLAEQARSFGIKYLVWSERNLPGSPDRTSVQLVIMITDDVSTEDGRL